MTAADDELTAAEQTVRSHLPPSRTLADGTASRDGYALDAVMAEYDRRGAEHGHQAERIAELVGQVEAQAGEIERLRTWSGLMSLLDEHYPLEVFNGSSDDPGPRIVVLVREIDQLRQQRAAALALIDDLLHPWNTGRPVHPGYEGVEAGFQYKRHVNEWNARRAALGAAGEPTTGGGSDA